MINNNVILVVHGRDDISGEQCCLLSTYIVTIVTLVLHFGIILL